MAGFSRLVNRVNTSGYDYDIEHIRDDGRQSTLALSAVFLGFTVQFGTIMVGGIIGLGLSFWTAVLAILLADAILVGLSFTTTLIGRRVGLGFSMLCRYPFGHKGVFLPALIYGIVAFGWLALTVWIFANAFMSIAGIIHPGWETAGFIIGAVLAGLLTVIPILLGFRGPKWVGYVSIPLFMVPIIYVMARLVVSSGGWGAIDAYVPPQPIPFAGAVTLAIGAWVMGAISCPDFTRMARSDRGALIAPAVGLFFGESLVLILGALTAAATGGATWNPIEAAAGIGTGLMVVVLVLYLVACWCTYVPTAWMSSMHFAAAFNRRKTMFAVALAIIAPVVAAIVQYSVGALMAILAFLTILTSVIPPIGGILVAEYFFVRKRELPYITSFKRSWNPGAYITWIIAGGFNYWTNSALNTAGPGAGLKYGIPGLNGFVVAIVVYLVVLALAKAANLNWHDLQEVPETVTS